MTRTHEIKLDGYGAHTTLAEDRPVMLLGTAESYGIEMLHIVPGKDWAELTITATFNAADSTSTDVLMGTDGNIAVPTEATAKSGSGRIVFTGVSNGIQRISCDLEYFVVAHSAINGAQSGGVAPSWFEQAANRFMPPGGTTGQVLTKKTDADFDAEWQDSNGDGGGISTTARNLLITILRSGVYTADQSNNITALDTALGGGTTEPEEPDVPVETTYAISNELINCTSSNRTTSVKENAAYSTTLTANDGYTLTGGTVTVTMGGVDITSTAYADGVISIASVTGDVEIFASAVVVQAEAALPEDGLISYFDFRTTTYDNVGSGGKTTIAPTKGSGHLYIWANNSISMQNEYGLNPANTRDWTYDQNGGTNETALGDSFTVIQLTYGEVPKFGFNYSNLPPKWQFHPEYINASGSTVAATAVIGSNFNSDNKHDYNFTVFRADGATLTEIFDTSRTTYNGGDIDGFSRWLDTPFGNAATMGDNIYCTAMAIYNRVLTDSEIEAAREFMKTLEVTA